MNEPDFQSWNLSDPAAAQSYAFHAHKIDLFLKDQYLASVLILHISFPCLVLHKADKQQTTTNAHQIPITGPWRPP